MLAACGDSGAARHDAAVSDALEDAPPDVGIDAIEIATGPWGTPARVFPLETASQDDPTLTADLLEMYFDQNGDIYVTTRASTSDPWSMPIVSTALSSPQLDGSPEITGDGLTIYLDSRRAPVIGQNDIWMATRASRTSPWTTPVQVTELCSTDNDDSATPMDNGLVLVMQSDRNATEARLYISTRASTSAAWSMPVELAELTTGIGDYAPLLAADGRTIYFDSLISNMGDLYSATRATPSGSFENAQVISELSTAFTTDADPWVSPDGHVIVFSRYQGGVDTLWQASR